MYSIFGKKRSELTQEGEFLLNDTKKFAPRAIFSALQKNLRWFDQSERRKKTKKNMPTQYNMATPTMDEWLIFLVQNYKELYDRIAFHYKEKELKENIWTSVATELDIDGQ